MASPEAFTTKPTDSPPDPERRALSISIPGWFDSPPSSLDL